MIIDDGTVQNLFGSVFSSFYRDAELIQTTTSGVRNPVTGTFPEAEETPIPCKAQKDKCTIAQRSEEGYSPKDVRFLVLQAGLGVEPTTDSKVVYSGARYLVMSINHDPARAYWDLRARLTP